MAKNDVEEETLIPTLPSSQSDETSQVYENAEILNNIPYYNPLSTAMCTERQRLFFPSLQTETLIPSSPPKYENNLNDIFTNTQYGNCYFLPQSVNNVTTEIQEKKTKKKKRKNYPEKTIKYYRSFYKT